MKYLIFISTITLASIFPLANNSIEHLSNNQECEYFIQLNNKFQTSIELTKAQKKTIRKINHEYWANRKQLTDRPHEVGHNTALLACWDEWRIHLSKNLDEVQMNKFMAWQSQVDLLGNNPL